MTQSLPDDFQPDSVVPKLQHADTPKTAPDGWTRLSGKIVQDVKTDVGGLLPGRQMTEEELRDEMDAFYNPPKGSKPKYISHVEQLPER